MDLDNTIYPVNAIGDNLFGPVIELIEQNGAYSGTMNQIKTEIMKRPFQGIANDFSFSEDLKAKCLNLLSDLTYNKTITPFEDYIYLKEIPCEKFLVTTGFTKMQYSKIEQLNIKNDFTEIFVIDPAVSDLTKKDLFRQILNQNNYKTDEVVVVGDDLNSEIAAARELGLTTVLYDHTSDHAKTENQIIINNFRELQNHI